MNWHLEMDAQVREQKHDRPLTATNSKAKTDREISSKAPTTEVVIIRHVAIGQIWGTSALFDKLGADERPSKMCER